MYSCSLVRRSTGLVALAGLLAVPGMAQLNLPPAGEVYLGIQADPQLGSGTEQAIEVREGGPPNGVGRTFALHLHYYAWKDLAQELDASGRLQPDSALQGDISHGRVPVISWKCDATIPNSDAVIANGNSNEDAVILATASALAQYPGPVILRWFWEFNIGVNNQACRGDTGGTPTPQVYASFIGAWQHIRTLFQSAGAANVIFLWNPGAGGHDATGFYPGNELVDAIGVDTYQRSPGATFADDFDSFYQQFSASGYGNKPLMVGENAAHGMTDYGTEQQATYLSGLLADVQAGRYPLLKGYCYFDSTGANGNWVLDSSGGLAAFTTLANSPSFAARPRERRRSVRHR